MNRFRYRSLLVAGACVVASVTAPGVQGQPPGPELAAPVPVVAAGPWWNEFVGAQQRAGSQIVLLTLDVLALETLRYSYGVQALRLLPEIRESLITQAEAEFDPEAFVDARWYDRDEPVGSFLATGGLPRLLEETYTENLGIRQKTTSGAEIEFGQRLGLQDSNSQFFTPTDQVQTRMAISVTQPLLRGSGQAFNRSLIVLARYETRLAWNEFSAGLQDRLLDVINQYWELYYQRSLVLQKQRNLDRARAIQVELESREAVDSLRSQVARAQAKVASREAGLLRAQAGVRNAEARLRALINSPLLEAGQGLELVPLEAPHPDAMPVNLGSARQTALANRPEINGLLTRIQSACVRTNIAENQVMPSLALILEGYVNGIQGDYRLGRSFSQQFDGGAPSYTAGLAFEMPLGNRRARAHLRQRALELQRLYRELNATTAELGTEVEVALREVNVTHAELASRLEVLAATRTEVDYLEQRWRLMPGIDQSASLLLEDLLDAEERLVDEEQLAASAQIAYAVSQAELKRTMGTLVVANPSCPPGPGFVSSPVLGVPFGSVSVVPMPAPAETLPPIQSTQSVLPRPLFAVPAVVE